MALEKNGAKIILILFDKECKKYAKSSFLAISGLETKYLQCFDFYFKFSWLHLTATPSVGIKNNHRISINNALQSMKNLWKYIFAIA